MWRYIWKEKMKIICKLLLDCDSTKITYFFIIEDIRKFWPTIDRMIVWEIIITKD